MNARGSAQGDGVNARPEGYHFHPLPIDAAAPEAWRALDRAVARWVVIHGGSPLLALVAGWASLAEGHGDSALPLTGPDGVRHGMGALDDEARTALQGEPMVCVIGSGQLTPTDTPFVIDHEHFYLCRNFRYEVAVAQRIQMRRAARLPAGQVSAADLDVLFHGAAGIEVQAQRNAVAGVSGRRLFVLTGGPGTGKTTTVLRMLLMLIKDGADRGAPERVIRLSAPTGKAAQRLSESLRDGAKRLREHADHPLPAAWQTYLDAALGADASTLHRLLGSRGRSGGFRYHVDDPLPADIVVVDEASMVDLALLRALLDALRDDAALILVGDADQLTSVGTGSVLLDLVSALETDGAPELVRLQHSFRADQTLVPINQAILRGDAAAFASAWQAAGAHAVRREVATTQDLRRVLGSWCRALRQLLQDSGAYAAVPAARDDLVLAALDGLRARQLLCALRESEFGSAAVNAAIERTLNQRIDDYAGALWYPGRAVMITRNDAAAGLFNGDVGVCLLDTDGQLRVWFEVTVVRGSTSMPTASATDARLARTSGRVCGHHPQESGFRVRPRGAIAAAGCRQSHPLSPAAVYRRIARQACAGGVGQRRRAGRSHCHARAARWRFAAAVASRATMNH